MAQKITEVVFTKRAQKDLRKLNPQIRKRILSSIVDLSENKKKVLPLTGEFASHFKLRVGDYRVILSHEKDRYLIRFVRHRSKAYY